MTLVDLRVESSDRVVVVRLEGEIDMSNADRLGASLTDRVTSDALGLAVDLTAVRFLDSSGVQAVYELSERLRKRGQGLRLVVPPGSPVAETLRLVNASSAIGIVDTTDAAVVALRSSGEEPG